MSGMQPFLILFSENHNTLIHYIQQALINTIRLIFKLFKNILNTKIVTRYRTIHFCTNTFSSGNY